MIIVKLRVTRQLPASYWKEKALGTLDPYGNPFRIITLKWNRNRLHKNSEYTKTRGFEDAVISQSKEDGDFDIKYRRNGSVMWQKPEGGVGPFFGELPYTPYNISKLVTHYGDGLWTIADADIDRMVRIKYEEMMSKMPDNLKKFNEDRVHAMHVSDIEVGKVVKHEVVTDPLTIKEKERTIAVKQTDIEKKAAELERRERALAEREAMLVKAGVEINQYSEQYLNTRSIQALRKTSKELKLAWTQDMTRADLIKIIVDAQNGKKLEVKVPGSEQTNEEEEFQHESLDD